MKILLIFRAPLGGLFRHVTDLLDGFRRAGHDVGLVFDKNYPLDKDILEALFQKANLGVERFPISRLPSVGDIEGFYKISSLQARHKYDVIHGHGAKGGLFARLLRGMHRRPPAAIYTLHGGSLHYQRDSFIGRFLLWTERQLLGFTDGLIFESEFAKCRFIELIGSPICPFRVIYNGLHASEFVPCGAQYSQFDFVFLGELRLLKGVDVLLKAMQRLESSGRKVSLAIFGKGPDEAAFRKLSRDLGLREIKWLGPVTAAREAICRGRCLILPSRAESFPYVALEAVGMQVPVIATKVGGFPEIFGSDYPLVTPGDDEGLFMTMAKFLDGCGNIKKLCPILAQRAQKSFTVDQMVNKTLDFYRYISESPEK